MATNLVKWAKRHAARAGLAPKKYAGGGGGEGSRGGKVIGHTKSGKPIYAGGAPKGGKAKKPAGSKTSQKMPALARLASLHGSSPFATGAIHKDLSGRSWTYMRPANGGRPKLVEVMTE